jgi:hypothetical protein
MIARSAAHQIKYYVLAVSRWVFTRAGSNSAVRLQSRERPESALKRHPHATTDRRLATQLSRSRPLSRTAAVGNCRHSWLAAASAAVGAETGHLRVTVWSRGASVNDRSGCNCAGWPVPFVKTAASRTSSVSSICRQSLPFNAHTQTKAFVAPDRDLITFLFVCVDAADIRHEYTGFPRDVGADVP